MSTEHWWLLVFWIMYGVLHSVLASLWWKGLMSRLMKRYFSHYRLLYSLFATVTLVLIVIYQYNIETVMLWERTIFISVVAVLCLLAGLSVMGLSIRKYFLYLSGIDSIVHVAENPGLQQDGLHAYVRHPLYSGTILALWSIFALFPYLNNLVAVSAITLYTLIGIRLEEHKLRREFGNNYIEYARRVPMLIPRSW